MRSIIVVVIMLALIGLTGCAKKDTAPADQPETQPESQTIATEDFESGEVEAVVEDGEEVVEDTPTDEAHGETP